MSLEKRAREFVRSRNGKPQANADVDHQLTIARDVIDFAAPYEAALRELMKALPSELHCHELHHPKKDRHGLTADCPVEERYKQALASASALLGEQE